MKPEHPPVIPITPLYTKRKKIHPRTIHGLFQRWRWVFVWLTQLVFYGLPWLPWNGRQAVLFDLDARRFYVFDFVLWPQDTIYLAAILVLSALALFLFTAVAGRLWCGYTCPQTVYTEIFLWIEARIEGDRNKRLKLDAAPWSARKLRLKTTKHLLWFAIAAWTGFTFVGYFTPIHQLGASLVHGTLGGWEIFWVVFYAFATYGNAGFMREQMCKYICPYAQFQTVMFDSDTMIVAYDEQRGEARGGRSKKTNPADAGLGDCVDCGICVQVCPTGIDIRDGLQMECIGCAACIDACDQVMDKMSYPRGLIRYSSENALAGGASPLRQALRPRVLVYTAVFLTLTFGLVWSLATRVPLKIDLQRDRNTLAREVAGGQIENVFQLEIINATEAPHRYRLSITGPTGVHLAEPYTPDVDSASRAASVIRVRVPVDSAPSGAQPLRFTVTDVDNPAVTVTEQSKFWMP
ncbi:cytochrome c oxidase accessory protein CcoG [Nitrogeniibacter mangrovi]|uniref:Cytochrome c oxidase accessory protein CcoG n=1 Tax=Nitrogeniibacter mangrovi TaxID=2016596 RepID=A0A6C1B207_9RHOO|nr:cytochrome c oxidase accessory protein CcoG [Nitrogeniibacter mangrovi]QID17671.1 cytochrome c oxidase accessory protein CcoG [Nitrogeniibacter mangrovi]